MPTEPPDGEIDRRVDADDIAIGVKRRPARVAFVDGRVDLDVIVIRSRADVAAARRDDAGGDGFAEAERIADRDDPIADARLMLGEFHVREGLVGVDLDEGNVGLRVGADDLGLVFGAIVGGDLHGLGVFDDVVIGHRVAVGRNEEARAFAGDDLLALRHHAVRHAGEAELLEEFFHRRSGRERVAIAPSCQLMPLVLADSSILTRTEMTAGLTLATRSANPAGEVAASAACAPDSGERSRARNVAGPAATIAITRPATDAISARRRPRKRFVFARTGGLL